MVTTPTTTMTCPKCLGEMRLYERNGVMIDVCVECRGIFLDRGELEELLELKPGYLGVLPPPTTANQRHATYRDRSMRRQTFLDEVFD
jgi:hypothetical protein